MKNLPMMKKPIFEHFLGPKWYPLLQDLFEGDLFHQIGMRIMYERGTGKKIIPPHESIHLSFRAFRLCDPDNLKIILLAQDPYPRAGVFDGLAFSNGNLPEGSNNVSPSLATIFDEINRDIYKDNVHYNNPDLERWAKQGILLLNSALTLEEGKSGSHIGIWEPFTRLLIAKLTEYRTGLIFLLWGAYAQKYQHYIKNVSSQHIITAGHPSPSNRTNLFYGSGVFSKTNRIITDINGPQYTITW